MPIGKQSINRVAKKADVEEVKPIVAEEPAKEKKPATAKKSGSGATCKKSTKPAAPKAEKTVAIAPEAKEAIPAVQGHVIANIDPEVVEKVVGKKTEAPKDGKVKVTDPMPSYLL